MGYFILSKNDDTFPITWVEEEGGYNPSNLPKRKSKFQVLDGETIIQDFGVRESDRTIEISGGKLYPLDEDMINSIKEKYELKETLNFTDSKGNKWEVVFDNLTFQKLAGMNYYQYEMRFEVIRRII